MARDLSALDRLTALVPPPDAPLFGTRDWDAIFTELGLVLPPDFVAFAERYGSSSFARWLAVSDPRGWSPEVITGVSEWMDFYRDLREDSPEDYTLGMWPEPGGFFLWGSTIDGDHLGWMTSGDPEQWPVMLIKHEAENGELHAETMTEWLAGWAAGARFDGSGFARREAGHPLVCERLE